MARQLGNPNLTPRENEVIKLKAQGHDYKAIAAILCVSPETALTHWKNIMGKLRARNDAHAIHMAWERGILPGTPNPTEVDYPP